MSRIQSVRAEPEPVDSETCARASQLAGRIVDNVSQALAGKREVIQLSVTALLARGHLLIEDVPGVGKTTLARALARSVGLTFRRLQFTSDMMPADVLGGSVYDPSTGKFDFRAGPVFTNVLLADEINRTTPKTQSALLEAMGEQAVSIDGETRQLDSPFFVVATQNPEEFFGTYPLPESQLDRFLLRLRVGYAEPAVERKLLGDRRGHDPLDDLSPVATSDEVQDAQRAVDAVTTEGLLLDYVHEIVMATRKSPHLRLGASTRAALMFERAARAFALVSGRNYVTPDDVKAVAVAALAHRVRANDGASSGGGDRDSNERVVRSILDEQPVPI